MPPKNSRELRDPGEARRFLLQGLWFQCVLPPAAAGVRPALALALEMSAAGYPLLPVGCIADVGNAAVNVNSHTTRALIPLPGVPANLLRTYEDHVLGKLYADWTFARASDALRSYEGRDRIRGLVFLLGRFCERAGLPGVEMSPSIIKSIAEIPADQALVEGWEMLARDGPHSLLLELYAELPAAARQVAEVLGPEDVFELEHRTALAEPGERLALRQVLQSAGSLDAALPRQLVRSPANSGAVPTRILDEDTYPVGGFSSLSTRGSIESLLHSQLAYMEPAGERPDLFDIKFLRDELLYYARDENQFLRRRRTFVFVLSADLVSTRFKDPELPFQRGVLLLALIVVTVRRLSEWLSTDALAFEIVFIHGDDDEPLAAERGLLEILLREPMANGSARLLHLPAEELSGHCTELARRSLCHCLVIGAHPGPVAAADVTVTCLQVDGPRPTLHGENEALPVAEAEDAQQSWARTLENLLQLWV